MRDDEEKVVYDFEVEGNRVILMKGFFGIANWQARLAEILTLFPTFADVTGERNTESQRTNDKPSFLVVQDPLPKESRDIFNKLENYPVDVQLLSNDSSHYIYLKDSPDDGYASACINRNLFLISTGKNSWGAAYNKAKSCFTAPLSSQAVAKVQKYTYDYKGEKPTAYSVREMGEIFAHQITVGKTATIHPTIICQDTNTETTAYYLKQWANHINSANKSRAQKQLDPLTVADITLIIPEAEKIPAITPSLLKLMQAVQANNPQGEVKLYGIPSTGPIAEEFLTSLEQIHDLKVMPSFPDWPDNSPLQARYKKLKLRVEANRATPVQIEIESNLSEFDMDSTLKAEVLAKPELAKKLGYFGQMGGYFREMQQSDWATLLPILEKYSENQCQAASNYLLGEVSGPGRVGLLKPHLTPFVIHAYLSDPIDFPALNAYAHLGQYEVACWIYLQKEGPSNTDLSMVNIQMMDYLSTLGDPLDLAFDFTTVYTKLSEKLGAEVLNEWLKDAYANNTSPESLHHLITTAVKISSDLSFSHFTALSKLSKNDLTRFDALLTNIGKLPQKLQDDFMKSLFDAEGKLRSMDDLEKRAFAAHEIIATSSKLTREQIAGYFSTDPEPTPEIKQQRQEITQLMVHGYIEFRPGDALEEWMDKYNTYVQTLVKHLVDEPLPAPTPKAGKSAKPKPPTHHELMQHGLTQVVKAAREIQACAKNPLAPTSSNKTSDFRLQVTEQRKNYMSIGTFFKSRDRKETARTLFDTLGTTNSYQEAFKAIFDAQDSIMKNDGKAKNEWLHRITKPTSRLFDISNELFINLAKAYLQDPATDKTWLVDQVKERLDASVAFLATDVLEAEDGNKLIGKLSKNQLANMSEEDVADLRKQVGTRFQYVVDNIVACAQLQNDAEPEETIRPE